jgi:hypothetical protein
MSRFAHRINENEAVWGQSSELIRMTENFFGILE